MSRRFISLYYGSIGGARALDAILCWVWAAFVPAARQRSALCDAVRRHMGGGEVFAFGSGRSALAACLKAAGIGPGDEVLLSTYTCLAVPTAVVAAGATPVYVDINPETLNVDAAAVLAGLSPRVRAVVVQHTLGKAAPIRPILEGAKSRGVIVIEDCALSIDSRLGDRYLGTFGDAAFFSMELSKTVSCGWGGLLLVHDAGLAAAVRAQYAEIPEPGAWGSTRDLWQTVLSAWAHQPEWFHRVGKYVLFLGFKSGVFRRSTPAPEFDGRIGPGFIVKMGGPQAGLATLQWRDLTAIAARCHEHARMLREALHELRVVMPGTPEQCERSISPRVSFLAADRQEATRYFDARGISLGQWFDGPLSPVPTSPLFNFQADRYPNAAWVAQRVINLPCHSRMTVADVAHVAATLRDFVRERPGAVIRHHH